MTSTAPLFIPSIPVQGPDHLILGFARDARRPERLVAVGGQRVDVALLSEDHGRTWQALPSPGKGLRGAWLDGDTLWVCGEYGFLACSRDGGASFTAVDTGSGGCLFGVAVDEQGVVWYRPLRRPRRRPREPARLRRRGRARDLPREERRQRPRALRRRRPALPRDDADAGRGAAARAPRRPAPPLRPQRRRRATLLARVDGERAIQELLSQRREKPARAIDAALAFRGSLAPAEMRHLLLAEADRLATDDVGGRAALDGLLVPRPTPSPAGHDVLVRLLGGPSPWTPPAPLPPPSLSVPPALEVAPAITLSDEEVAALAEQIPHDGHWRFQIDATTAVGDGDDDDDSDYSDDDATARDLVRNLRGAAADAYVAFRERWRLPTPSALYLLLPARLHARLVALGAATGEGRWNHWRGALVRGGEVVLPGLRAFVHGDADLDDRLTVLLAVGDVVCIGPVVEAFAGKKHKALARQWILRHRRHAIAGALTLLVVDSVTAELKDGAARVLRFLDGVSARDAILGAARAHSAALASTVTTLLDEDPLLQPGAKAPSLPAWAQPAALPRPVTLAGQPLVDDDVKALLVRLAASNADELHPALQAAKRTLTSSSLAALARALFEAWLREGADPKHACCMLAVGVFGDDALVRELAGLVKAWPGESAAARAQQGLDVLVVHGGDVALLQVSLIAEKSKFAALKKGAAERIGAIAERRGLTRDELADRLVPTFGLDDEAGAVLDFGVRRFSVPACGRRRRRRRRLPSRRGRGPAPRRRGRRRLRGGARRASRPPCRRRRRGPRARRGAPSSARRSRRAGRRRGGRRDDDPRRRGRRRWRGPAQ